jgi:hypothetical protein
MTPREALAAATLAASLAAALASPARGQNADFVWYGGPILAGTDARPEALAVKNGRIVALGSRAEIEKKWRGKLTLPIDLNGQALVAGIVASPPPAPPVAVVAKAPKKPPAPKKKALPPPPPAPRPPVPPLEALAADVSPPPEGLPYSITAIRDALRIWMLRSSFPRRHRVVLGFGYDETKLEEKRPPTREELDTVSATLPVIVVSRAGDAGAYNTIALQKAGISWRTKDPPGGVIRRRGRIFEPSGVLEGTAHVAAFAKLVPRIDDAGRSRLHAEDLKLSAPEELETMHAAPAAPEVPTPAAAPTPAPTPFVAAVSLQLPPGRRETGSEALAALVADVLAGRATLETGRPADMSVLSDDPSAAEPGRREKVRVVEEVRRGRTVWRRDPTALRSASTP